MVLSSSTRRELRETRAPRREESTDVLDVAASESAHVWGLRPVSYRAIEDAGNEDAPVYYGFIAEEVAEVDPRLCFWGQDAEGMPRVEGVNYDQVTPLLLQETKQLKAGREQDSVEIAVLKAARAQDRLEMEALKTQMQTLLLEVQQLKGAVNIH